MKNLILGLENNRQVYVFVILGIILIIFPNQVGNIAPYLIGIGLLLYGGVNIVISIKYPDSSVSLGNAVISCVTGVVLLVLKGNSIAIIGVVWAVISLYEAAREIDEYYWREKKVRVIGIVSVIVSIGLAVILITNPFAHFNMHVRILGIEMIAYAILRGGIERKKKKENS